MGINGGPEKDRWFVKSFFVVSQRAKHHYWRVSLKLPKIRRSSSSVHAPPGCTEAGMGGGSPPGAGAVDCCTGTCTGTWSLGCVGSRCGWKTCGDRIGGGRGINCGLGIGGDGVVMVVVDRIGLVVAEASTVGLVLVAMA